MSVELGIGIIIVGGIVALALYRKNKKKSESSSGSGGGGTRGTDGFAPGIALAHGRVPLGDAPAPKFPSPGGVCSLVGTPGARPVGAPALRGP